MAGFLEAIKKRCVVITTLRHLSPDFISCRRPHSMKKAPKQTSLPLSKAVEGFMLAAAARGLSDHTVLDYQNTIKKLVAFLEGDPVIAEITVSQIREFLAGQSERISNKTLLNYHTGLSALWKWALDEKLVTENIVRNIPAPKPEDRRIIPFTEAEIKLLLGALERSKPYTRPGKKLSDHAIPGVERNRALAFLLIDCGLRATELCELTIQNVDIRNHRVLVMGKGSKERLIPFSARTGQALWRYTH
jgi:site-specific recombinase XerD